MTIGLVSINEYFIGIPLYSVSPNFSSFVFAASAMMKSRTVEVTFMVKKLYLFFS